MIKHKYGNFTDNQINLTKDVIRKRIFFLLIVAEKPEEYPDINLEAALTNTLRYISGLSSLLGNPQEIVGVLCLLEEAKNQIKSSFDFKVYRKLILDAGAEIMKVGCGNA